jgi:diacylglycerol O-acyltransferase / wax synthase
MSYTYYERLSALDASFLALEDHTSHMHIGAAAIFESAPLQRPDGGIDIDRVRALMEAGLYRIPRYRQRLAWIPVLGHPVWIDDTRFNLAYHLRHTHLPVPGDERQLKRLVGRLMSQQLDRGKPLWEMWVVEGLQGGRFALVTKIHHCMIDGVGSVELTGSVMRTTPDPDPRLAMPPPRWVPRAAPSGARLLAEEMFRRALEPLALAGALRRSLGDVRGNVVGARRATAGLVRALSSAFQPASPTPLNQEIGPHRRFDWTVMELDAVREVKARLGGTVNDVVLAIVTGALRRFLRRRGMPVRGLDFRAMVPVNVRATEEHDALGNRVAMLVARLPLDEPDARRRLEKVSQETQQMKESGQARGVRLIEELSDHGFTALFTQFARLTARSRPYNVVVTNVPGPQFPVYVEGARMLESYPLVPLFHDQTLGIALLSYDGRLHWGFNADWDALPDLHDVVEAVTAEFEALRAVAAGWSITVPPEKEAPAESSASGRS